MEQQLSGPMKDFKLQAFLDVANELVRSDEVANALWLLESGIPGFYRDFPPKEITDLKNEIMANIATSSFYATDSGAELQSDPNIHKIMKHSFRGDMLLKEMKFLNKNGFVPTLADLAPGEYAFVKMLIEEKTQFLYMPIWVNYPSYKHYHKDFESQMGGVPREDQPKVFFACEILEHLWHPEDLRYEMNRHCGMADVLFFSTPRHTFDTQCDDWRKKGALGHLRTFTPQEFVLQIQKLFPEYHLSFFDSQPMQIRATWKDSNFDVIKTPIEEIFK